MAALAQPHSSPPSSLLTQASDRWHHLGTSLLASVDREIDQARQGLLAEYSDLTVFTLYLAAEKKAAEAFPTLLRLLSVEDFRTLERFGEVFTGDMPVILADCYPGPESLPALEAIVTNHSLAVACRRAVLNALEILACQQRISLADLRGFLERLADGALEAAQPRLWNAFAEICLAAGLADFEPVVEEAYARRWMDSQALTPAVLAAAFTQVREGTYHPFSGPVTIESAAAEIESWNWDQAGQESPPAGRPGRNDPCPCGSGKKFKRCCSGR